MTRLPLVIGVGEPRVFVGRLAATPGSPGFELPARLRSTDSELVAFGKDGVQRTGKQTDVKAGQHWVLAPTPGGYVARPVHGWFDFSPPAFVQAPRVATPAPGRPRAMKEREVDPNSAEAGELEMLKASGLRKEFADRWGGMLERRAARVGVPVKRGEILKVNPPSDAPLKVAYPEEEKLRDELGLNKEKQKKRKALKKEAKAEFAEDDDVPDSANSLLSLKSQRGEAKWDFEDEEAFSDDGEDKWDFNDDLQKAPGEVAPEADEDEGPEGENLLGSHGKELETLMQRMEKGGRSPSPSGAVDAEDGSASELSEGEHCAKKRRLDEPPMLAAVPLRTATALEERRIVSKVAEKASRSTPHEKVRSSKAQAIQLEEVRPAKTQDVSLPEKARSARSHDAGSSRAPPTRAEMRGQPVPTPAAQGSPEKPAPDEAVPSDDELRARVVDCFRKRGGTCGLSDAAAALCLKDRKSALYQRAVAVLKEVSTTQRLPGEARPVLVLKPDLMLS